MGAVLKDSCVGRRGLLHVFFFVLGLAALPLRAADCWDPLEVGTPLRNPIERRERKLQLLRRFLDTADAQKKDSDSALIRELFEHYPSLKDLAGKVESTAIGGTIDPAADKFYSEQLFGAKHIELDRTLQGILVLRWFLTGQYERTVESQKAPVMDRATFDYYRAFLDSRPPMPPTGIAEYDADPRLAYLDLMLRGMVVNDLGKVESFKSRALAEMSIDSVDHDKILYEYARLKPEQIPEIADLNPEWRALIIRGLELSAHVNIGQVLQMETPGIAPMDTMMSQAEYWYFFGHFLVDLGGASGHVNRKGAPIINNTTSGKLKYFMQSVSESMQMGPKEFAAFFGWMLSQNSFLAAIEDVNRRVAFTRLALLVGASTAEESLNLSRTFDKLDERTQKILIENLSVLVSETQDRPAFLLYYAPAVISNARGAATNGGEAGVLNALRALARIMQETRVVIAKQAKKDPSVQKRKIVSIFVREPGIKVLEAKDSALLNQVDFAVKPKGKDYNVEVVPAKRLDLSQIPVVTELGFSGKPRRVLVVGMGGGSDGGQAAAISSLIQSGDQVVGLLSVRTKLPGSVDSSGRRATSSDLENPLRTFSTSLYEIGTATTGSGRFLEAALAAKIRTFRLNEDASDPASFQEDMRKIQAELGFDAILAFDTGGDLVDFGEDVWTALDQNQDQRVALAFVRFFESSAWDLDNLRFMVASPGIDTTESAAADLLALKAEQRILSESEAEELLAFYRDVGLDGSKPALWGKTAFTFQKALRSEFGLQVIQIPMAEILNPKNPWVPYVQVQPEMRSLLSFSARNFVEVARQRSLLPSQNLP